MNLSLFKNLSAITSLLGMIPNDQKDELLDLFEKALSDKFNATKKPVYRIGLGIMFVVRGMLGMPDDDKDQSNPV